MQFDNPSHGRRDDELRDSAELRKMRRTRQADCRIVERERRHPLQGTAPLKSIETAFVSRQTGRSHSSPRGVNRKTAVFRNEIVCARNGPNRGSRDVCRGDQAGRYGHATGTACRIGSCGLERLRGWRDPGGRGPAPGRADRGAEGGSHGLCSASQTCRLAAAVFSLDGAPARLDGLRMDAAGHRSTVHNGRGRSDRRHRGRNCKTRPVRPLHWCRRGQSRGLRYDRPQRPSAGQDAWSVARRGPARGSGSEPAERRHDHQSGAAAMGAHPSPGREAGGWMQIRGANHQSLST